MIYKDNIIPKVRVGILSNENINVHFNNYYVSEHKEYAGNVNCFLDSDKINVNGILTQRIIFSPINSDATFSLEATIGKSFHWERNEMQTFQGAIELVVQNHSIQVINIINVEDYLKSVICSEMSGNSSLELLKAHAVISRSWLLRLLEKSSTDNKHCITDCHKKIMHDSPELLEYIAWYDNQQHECYDVCADDHCQRYQGIQKNISKQVIQAINDTKGEVIMNENAICDARFSKCCGGALEEYSTCWEDLSKSYLSTISDDVFEKTINLSNENTFQDSLKHSSKAFCNTHDITILKKVLNNYDYETTDFFRWKVEYSSHQLRKIIQKKINEDIGEILEIHPIERGKGGKIFKIKITGSRKTIIVGKELEIRRLLSDTHLYSSAFIVEKKINRENPTLTCFVFHGSGWGHGVGLCQIGAAVMSELGYTYQEILQHYYKHSTISKIY